MENGIDQTEQLTQFVQWYEEAEELSVEARKNSERNRDYYDNIQFTKTELANLRGRKQPPIVINRIKPKIDYLTGYEAANRTDPRGYPRNPQDEDASEAVTDALRAVQDAEKFNQKFSDVWENMLIEGYGGIELTIDPENRDIKSVSWPWDRLFYDPHSSRHDFSDARYLGGISWMDAEEAKRRWSGIELEAVISATLTDGDADTYADKPEWKKWTSGKARKRVRIVQIYYKDGDDWHWCIFTKGGKLAGGSVEFRDQDGKSFCPLFLQSSLINRENQRYGVVDSMIGPQDEINKRRSKALHLLNSNQTRGESGAVDDVDEMKRQLALPNGHVETNPGTEWDIISSREQMVGQLELLQEAKREIELMGPNAALQGKQDQSASGRAILASQQGGQTEISRLLDRHRDFKRRVYEATWWLIRQYKDAEWWVRVTDDEKNVKFVGFNRPVTMAEELQKRLMDQGADEQQAQEKIAELGNNPQLQQVVRTENVPADMNMDVILEEVPDVANLQEEQFKMLTQLASAGITFPEKVYIQASALRDKSKLLKMIEEAQNDPEVAQKRQQAEQLEIGKVMAEISETEASAMQKRAAAYKAVTDADAVDGEMGNDVFDIEPEQLPPPPDPNGAAPVDQGQQF